MAELAVFYNILKKITKQKLLVSISLTNLSPSEHIELEQLLNQHLIHSLNRSFTFSHV